MKTLLYPLAALFLFAIGCGSDGITGLGPADNLSSSAQTDGTPSDRNGLPGTRVDSFPIEVGMVWTYGDRKIRVTVPIRTVYGPAYGLEGLLQNRIIRKDEGGKILELRNDDWRLLFDLNAAEGTTWKLDTSQGEDDLLDGATVTVASRSEGVKVPYGKFEKSIHLVLRPRPGLADAGITDLWFVPGVGLVKGSEAWIGGSRSFNLTAFETDLPDLQEGTEIRPHLPADGLPVYTGTEDPRGDSPPIYLPDEPRGGKEPPTDPVDLQATEEPASSNSQDGTVSTISRPRDGGPLPFIPEPRGEEQPVSPGQGKGDPTSVVIYENPEAN